MRNVNSAPRFIHRDIVPAPRAGNCHFLDDVADGRRRCQSGGREKAEKRSAHYEIAIHFLSVLAI